VDVGRVKAILEAGIAAFDMHQEGDRIDSPARPLL